jgi:hypothetical protein
VRSREYEAHIGEGTLTIERPLPNRHAVCLGRGDWIDFFERIGEWIVLMISMAKITKRLKSTASKPEAAKPAEPKINAPKPAAFKVETLKPEASNGNRVSLELVKPDAKNVYVAGSFNEWKPERTPLAPRGNGRWAGDLAVKPGRHEYLFVVDGQWLPDPNAKESVQNPFGGTNSVLVVSS